MSHAQGTNEFSRGWRVLLVSFLGVGVSISSILFYSFGLWIVPWQQEFGWSRAEIGAAQTVTTVVLIMVLPLVGRAIDRFGVQKIAAGSMLLFSLSLFAAASLQGSLWHLYALAAAFAVTGAGASPVSFTRLVNGWFDKNRGFALGLVLMSTGIAAVLLPVFLAPYVAQNGWRAGFVVIATIVLIPLPLVWIWGKHSAPPDDATKPERVSAPPPQLLAQPGSRRVFVLLGVTFFLVALAVCGLIPNFVPMLIDGGLAPQRVGLFAALIGVSVIFGRLVTGLLVDRIFAPYVTAAVFLLSAVGLFIVSAGGVAYAGVAAVALGFAIGAEVDLIGYYTARYFGTSQYGVLFGLLYSAFSAGCAVSPAIVGYIWDATGSYDFAFLAASGLLVLATGLALLLPPFPVTSPEL